MKTATQAYNEWKAQHKVNLQVYTDEQMFRIGYEARDEYVRELEDMVTALINRMNEKKKK